MDLSRGVGGYLAVARFTMDDIPIVFTTNRIEAFTVLGTLGQDDLDTALMAADSDASMLCCGAVYTFEDGRVVACETGIDLPNLDTGHPAGISGLRGED